MTTKVEDTIEKMKQAQVQIMHVGGQTPKILSAVMVERLRQTAKFGVQNHSPVLWGVILGEEYGEACRAIYESTCCSPLDGEKRKAWLDNLREELVQVAAVAVAFIESLDRNELKA